MFSTNPNSSTISKVRKAEKELFELFERVNAEAISVGRQLKIAPDNTQEIIIATYFSRTVDNIQASVLLTERLLTVQGKVLLRAALESLFFLRACFNPAFFEKLLAADLVKRKKIYRKLDKLVRGGFIKDEKQILSEENLRQFEAFVAEEKAVDVSTEEMARIAGLHDLYLGLYSMLSTSVHSTLHDIELHTEISQKGKIRTSPREAAPDEIAYMLIGAIELLLIASLSIDACFEMGSAEYWNKEHKALQLLSQKRRAGPSIG